MPLSDSDLAYAAGIIDGEGSIGIVQSFAARTRGRYVYPVVSVTNTDHELIAWMLEKFPGGRVSKVHPSNKMHRLCSKISWACDRAADVVEMVLPWLIVKLARAVRMLKYWKENTRAVERFGPFGNGRTIPDWLASVRRLAWEDMTELNRGRGRMAGAFKS